MAELVNDLMRNAFPLHIQRRLIGEGCSLENIDKFKTELDEYLREVLNNPLFTEALVATIHFAAPRQCSSLFRS